MVLKVILSVLIGSWIQWGAFAALSERTNEPTSWVPFPWAKELPITGDSAQGVWLAGDKDSKSYFYIRVIQDNGATTGMNYLSIVEKDGNTCKTIATGFGMEQLGTRIRAIMKHTLSDERYVMFLRQYHWRELPAPQDGESYEENVMVLTLFKTVPRKTYNYPMVKVSDRTEFNCVPQK